MESSKRAQEKELFQCRESWSSRFPLILLPFSQYSPFALPIPHPLQWDTSLSKTFSFLFSPFTPISCFHYSAFFRLLLKYANCTSSNACILVKQILGFFFYFTWLFIWKYMIDCHVVTAFSMCTFSLCEFWTWKLLCMLFLYYHD